MIGVGRWAWRFEGAEKWQDATDGQIELGHSIGLEWAIARYAIDGRASQRATTSVTVEVRSPGGDLMRLRLRSAAVRTMEGDLSDAVRQFVELETGGAAGSR